jgi:ferredoxin
MIRIRHKAIECIGCAACVEIAPDYWHLDDDGMARLNEIRNQQGHYVLGRGFREDEATLRDAEANCPVHIIEIQPS